MKTIKELAVEVLAKFVRMERTGGKGFWSIQGDIRGSDEWIVEMCRNAHNGMLPDDYKYEFVYDALSDIANLSDDATAEDARDLQPEADIYTADLLSWLASNNTRVNYCDQYAEEFGSNQHDTTLMRIGFGQYLERSEVLHSVINSLEKRSEETEGE